MHQDLETISLVARFTNNLVIITDDQAKIIWVNDAFTKIMGYDIAEIKGKKPSEFIHGPLSDLYTSQLIKDAIKRNLPFKEEIIHYTKKKSPIWIMADGQPILGDSNQLLKYVIIETDITFQKKQQEEIRRSESYLNAFFNSTDSILVLFDQSHRVITFNKKAEQIINSFINKSIKVGDLISDLVLDSFREAFIHYATEALQGNAIQNREVKIEGMDVWWSIRFLPFYDSSQKIIGASFTAVDISERKEKEILLIENQKRFNLVTKATFDAIWDWDIEKDTIYRGEGFHSLFGYFPGTLKNDTAIWDNLIHQDDFEKVTASFNEILHSDQTNWIEEYRFLKANGEYTYVRDKAIIVRNDDGQALRVVGAMQDIDSQIKKEALLKIFESAITNTSDAVVITDVTSGESTDIKIIYVNDAFTGMTGYKVDEVIGKSPRFLQGPLSDQFELARLKDAIQNWKSCEIETVNYKKNGDPFWVNISIIPVANALGEFTHWVSIQKDVTERKNHMEERELMIQELTKNNIELKQFSYITSHNLRAPLTNMIGILSLLDTTYIQDKRVNQLIDGLKASTYKLNETMTDLVKVLIIKENTNLGLSKVYFKSVLAVVLKSAENIIHSSNTIIETDFSEAESVSFSKAYLESILMNLISNAIKFKLPEIRPKIKIWTSISNQCVQLNIADNGLGMDWEKVKHKVFGMYQRFHNNLESKGMGLFLVYAQVNALGGSINLSTEIDKGSTFTITFKKETN